MSLEDQSRFMVTAAFVGYAMNLGLGIARPADVERIQLLMDKWNSLEREDVAVWSIQGRNRVPVLVHRDLVTD